MLRSAFWAYNFTKYFQLLQHHYLKGCIFHWIHLDVFIWINFCISFFCISFFNLLHLLYIYVCVYVCRHMHATTHWEEVEGVDYLLPHRSQDWTHVIRGGNRYLYPMSHLTGPEFSFVIIYMYIPTLMPWNLALYSSVISLEERKADFA